MNIKLITLCLASMAILSCDFVETDAAYLDEVGAEQQAMEVFTSPLCKNIIVEFFYKVTGCQQVSQNEEVCTCHYRVTEIVRELRFQALLEGPGYICEEVARNPLPDRTEDCLNPIGYDVFDPGLDEILEPGYTCTPVPGF